MNITFLITSETASKQADALKRVNLALQSGHTAQVFFAGKAVKNFALKSHDWLRFSESKNCHLYICQTEYDEHKDLHDLPIEGRSLEQLAKWLSQSDTLLQF